jgi:hypothetical protein
MSARPSTFPRFKVELRHWSYPVFRLSTRVSGRGQKAGD